MGTDLDHKSLVGYKVASPPLHSTRLALHILAPRSILLVQRKVLRTQPRLVVDRRLVELELAADRQLAVTKLLEVEHTELVLRRLPHKPLEQRILHILALERKLVVKPGRLFIRVLEQGLLFELELFRSELGQLFIKLGRPSVELGLSFTELVFVGLEQLFVELEQLFAKLERPSVELLFAGLEQLFKMMAEQKLVAEQVESFELIFEMPFAWLDSVGSQQITMEQLFFEQLELVSVELKLVSFGLLLLGKGMAELLVELVSEEMELDNLLNRNMTYLFM